MPSCLVTNYVRLVADVIRVTFALIAFASLAVGMRIRRVTWNTRVNCLWVGRGGSGGCRISALIR